MMTFVEAMDGGIEAFENRDFAGAIRLFRCAAAAAGAGSLGQANALANIGQACLATGESREAREAFAGSLKIRARLLNPADPDIAESQHGLGTALLDLGRADEAIQHLESALAIRMEALGPHPQTLIAMHSLGEAYVLAGRHDEATRMLQSVLQALERVAPTGDRIAAVLMDLAAAELSAGQATAARPHVVRALGLTVELDHARALMQLAWLDNHAGDLGGAEDACRQALEIRERHLERDHRDVRTSRETLADLRSRRLVLAGLQAAGSVLLMPEALLPPRLPVFPLRNTVLLPSGSLPLMVGRSATMELVRSVGVGGVLVVVALRADANEPDGGDLYSVGCFARLVAVSPPNPDGSIQVVLQGIRRVRVDDFRRGAAQLTAAVSESRDTGSTDTDLAPLFPRLARPPTATPQEWAEWLVRVAALPPGDQAYAIGTTVERSATRLQALLEMTDIAARVACVRSWLVS